MTLLPGERIAIAGISGPRVEPRVGVIVGHVVVARLLSNGALDSSFGGDGRADIPSGQEPRSLKPGPQGSLFLRDSDSIWRLFKLTRDGTLDPSFGSGGALVLPSGIDPPGTTFLPSGDFAVLPGGGTLIAGTVAWAVEGQQRSKVGVLRLRPDGSPNPSFGDFGFVRVGFRGWTFAAGLAATADGHVVVVASSQVPAGHRSQLSAIALTPHGELDRRFGRGGKIRIGFGDWTVGEDLLLRGGRVLLVGGLQGFKTLFAQVPLARHS
jgi:uncharacterized delta-60 repeat protein